MARKRKRGVTPFPTFREETRCLGHMRETIAPALVEGISQSVETRVRGTGSRYSPEPTCQPPPETSRVRLLALQLALQRFDLFGQRGIPGDQCLDLAHGMQHRGVIAPAEPAADFGQ